MNHTSLKRGFTLMEIIIVVGIMAILAFVSTISLFSLQNKANLDATLETVVSDIKQQQLKAMVGDTESRVSGANYGIHFDSTSNPNKYIFFHGASYSSSDFSVNLDKGIVFSAVNLPGGSGNIIFNQISGEINGFVNNQNSITLKNTNNNQQKTIYFNRYGVIYQIN